MGLQMVLVQAIQRADHVVYTWACGWQADPLTCSNQVLVLAVIAPPVICH